MYCIHGDAYVQSLPVVRSVVHAFFFKDTAAATIYTLSLHDALPISAHVHRTRPARPVHPGAHARRHGVRSEEHTSELQSRRELVCRLLLEKKKTRCAFFRTLSKSLTVCLGNLNGSCL